uniref:uncharacterized protein LOC120348093 n=1 Tax=Styela clava TaxID=7725 RepID=UPI001939A34D|nr:uncharacterized protein LOC120348093 [Styela clava]
MYYNSYTTNRKSVLKCNDIIRIILLLFGYIELTLADVFCGSHLPEFGQHVRFCYGITAYCCGFQDGHCCWDSIWKIWWFWVVVLVVLGALFSCIGYFCTCINDDYNSTGRVSPFFAIRDGIRRRFSTQSSADVDDPFKEYRDRAVMLPPYYPTTSTVPVGSAGPSGGTDTYPDLPPPYAEATATTSENTPLLPVGTTTTSTVQNPSTTPQPTAPMPPR